MSAKEIIKAFPTPAGGGILSSIDKEACEKAVGQILAGGEETVHELVDLILEPGKGQDVQARHAVHATAIRVGGPDKTKHRKAFAQALADTLSKKRPKAVKGFVLRQLQVCGGQEQGSAIAKFHIKGAIKKSTRQINKYTNPAQSLQCLFIVLFIPINILQRKYDTL